MKEAGSDHRLCRYDVIKLMRVNSGGEVKALTFNNKPNDLQLIAPADCHILPTEKSSSRPLASFPVLILKAALYNFVASSLFPIFSLVRLRAPPLLGVPDLDGPIA